MIARRSGTALALIGLAWTVGLGLPSAAEASGCSGGVGVSVVVDFGQYGGVQTGCAPDPTNGFSALSQAGFSVVQPTMAPGFVCRIDGAPPAEDEACVRTPPATAYWSYWQAAPGGTSWTYSGQGAGSSQPMQGGTDGWAFGAGAPPGLAPPVNTSAAPPPPPPPPRPTSTSSRPPAPAPAPAEGGGGGATASRVPDPTEAAPGSGAPGTGSGAPPAGATSGPSATATASAAGSTEATPTEAAQAATTGGRPASSAADPLDPTGHNAPWGVLLAGAVAMALAGGAFWQVRRRR